MDKDIRSTIKDELTKFENEKKQSATYLNFFKILGLSNKELIHSKFIAFLLNNYKDKFLKIFIEMLKKHKPDIESPFQCECVKTENGSKINKEENKGGKVDIIIKNKNSMPHIVIENKIHANDQPSQLERYINTFKNVAMDPILVYLTLDGKDASTKSIGKNVKKAGYIKLSYKEDIIEWLESCLIFISNNEIKKSKKVKFLINEYLALVRELIKEQAKREKLLPILAKDKETLENVFKIHDNVCKKLSDDPADKEISGLIRPLKAYIIKTKFFNGLDELCNKNGWKWELNEVKWVTLKGWGFYIYKKEWDPQKDRVEFKFAREQLENLVYTLVKDGVRVQLEQGKLIELPKKYLNWHREVFYELMDVNIKIGLFPELERIISKMMC